METQFKYDLNPQVFETWNKPYSGPLTVQARNHQGRSVFTALSEAVELAKEQKALYPHMDFVVRSRKCNESSIVFDSSK